MVENDTRSRDLPQLQIHDHVRMQPIQSPKSAWEPAVVTEQLSPRAYLVKTPDNREFRRNRQFLRKSHASNPHFDKDPPASETQETSIDNPPVIATKSNEKLSNNPIEKPVTFRSIIENVPKSPMKTRSGRTVKKPQRFTF